MTRRFRKPAFCWSAAIFWLCLILLLLTPSDKSSSPWTITAAAAASSSSTMPLPDAQLANSILRSLEGGMRVTRRIPHYLVTKSMNALSSNKQQQQRAVQEVVATKRFYPTISLENLKNIIPQSAGYYYGIQPDRHFPFSHQPTEQETQLAMSQALTETLGELKTMRQEIKALRREMLEMRKKITGEQDLDYLDDEDQTTPEVDPEVIRLAKLKRQRKFERIGKEAERWAHRMLFEEERTGEGWVEVACNKVVHHSYNGDDRTHVYLGFFRDSRGKYAHPTDDKEHPCLKVYTTIDAPLEDVCEYLSQEQRLPEYNAILTDHRDLEEIAPNAKICWAVSPQILFLKPRDFVTYVVHKWSRDGNTLALINQAVEHDQAPAVTEEGKGKTCRGYALRGATFISRDPDDPEKTNFSMIAHAAPGGGIPPWACKTAANAIAPMEPYKLFHKINQNVQKAKSELAAQRLERTEEVSDPGRCNKPAGMAQIGWAAFWPNGGAPHPSTEEEEGPDNNKRRCSKGYSKSGSNKSSGDIKVDPKSSSNKSGSNEASNNKSGKDDPKSETTTAATTPEEDTA